MEFFLSLHLKNVAEIVNEGDTWFKLGNKVLEVGMSRPCLTSSLAQIHVQLGKIKTVCFYLLCTRFSSDVISNFQDIPTR